MNRQKKVIYIFGLWFFFNLTFSTISNSAYAGESTSPEYLSDEVDRVTTEQSGGCLVPCDQIVSGGPPPDGIPAIENPKFLSATDAGAPSDSETIIGVVVDGQPRAYSYDVLNWHEIVNEVIDGVHFSITYCPLTGSGVLYKTNIIEDSTLGTSGKLYENNLVFYDRVSNSYWSQMLGTAIKGEKVGEQLPVGEAVETTWRAWKKMYSDTVVLSRDTGYSRDYNRYPYGSYETDSSINFPTTYNPNIPPYNLYQEKEKTQVIRINDKALLIAFEELKNLPVLNHQFQGVDLVNFYVQEERMVITYKSKLADGTVLQFELANPTGLSETDTFGLPIYKDQFGTIWNVKGEAIAGEGIGDKLEMLPTYNAFWFSASALFYDALIFNSGDGTELIYDSFSVEPEFQEADFLDFPAIGFSIVALLVAAIAIPSIRKNKK